MATVPYHLLPVASLLTPLIFHYPLPLSKDDLAWVSLVPRRLEVDESTTISWLQSANKCLHSRCCKLLFIITCMLSSAQNQKIINLKVLFPKDILRFSDNVHDIKKDRLLLVRIVVWWLLSCCWCCELIMSSCWWCQHEDNSCAAKWIRLASTCNFVYYD
jgi:hypothetical protein